MDMLSLTNSLESCRAKYSRLGVQLGVDYNLIKEFESYSGDSAQCLWVMLQQYVSDMSPDVEEVCKAVGRVGRRDIEKGLREKYKGKEYCCIGR